MHSHGLGILAVGTAQSPAVAALLAAGNDDTATQSIREVFRRLGRTQNLEHLLARESAQREELAAGVASLVADRDRHAADSNRLAVQASTVETQRDQLEAEVFTLRKELTAGVASLVADRDRHAAESNRLAVHAGAVETQRNQLEAEVFTLRKECRRLESALSTTSLQLDYFRDQLAPVQAERTALAEQLSRQSAQLDSTRVELKRERRQRLKMKRSLSWRVSKPFRLIGTLGRVVNKPPPKQRKVVLAPLASQPAAREPLPPLLPPYFHDALKYAEPEPYKKIEADLRPA